LRNSGRWTSDVDRDHSHIFHKDYWALRAVRRATVDFTRQYGAELKGQRALDFGAGYSPYIAHFNALDCELLRADLAPTDAKVLRIGVDGRVPVEDGSMAVVLSTHGAWPLPSHSPPTCAAETKTA
jgi:hypothetical protein